MEQLAESLLLPAAVNSIAQELDRNEKGNPVQRKPKTVGQAIESGIPGLRKNVPRKKE